MAHNLETLIGYDALGNQIELHAFAFEGARTNIWHRLGQQFTDNRLMTAEEAMQHAHMDRKVYTAAVDAPEGVTWADGIQPYYVILDGKLAVTPEGGFVEIPSKIVGMTGSQGSIGHGDMSVLDRFQLAEEAIHASHGAAVWSTAGYIRDGKQGFATMEAPPTVVDPHGVADVYRQYMTIRWSYDATIVGGAELGASNVRVVCANTDMMHAASQRVLIKVKATSGAKERYTLAAEHWAAAQDEARALAIRGERMMLQKNGKQILGVLAEKVLGLSITADQSKRERTIRENKLDTLNALYYGPTNVKAVGDNGYAAYQTIVEYLDWYSPVKGDNTGDVQHVANQFDGTYDKAKAKAAELVLTY